jgi:hypothetical protein
MAQCVTVPAPAAGGVQRTDTDVRAGLLLCVTEPLQPLHSLLCVSPASSE